jgi:tripartite-type tricarboxylate transporter receptor subunit TctC
MSDHDNDQTNGRQDVTHRRFFLGAAGSALLAFGAVLLSPAAQAAYPERPITLLVAWAAGGGTDAVARVFASILQEELGQPVNVVNRTGGGGVVGHTAMANAAPDGYTLGIASMEITIYDTMGLAPITPDSFTPIARIAAIPAGLTVAADASYQDASALLEDIRAEPEGTFQSSGCSVGCAWHLALAGWLKAEGLEPARVTWVPSQGGAPALQDVVAGGIDFTTASIVESRALLEAGEVRALAVMNPERQEAFPEVPTLEEALGTDWSMSTWFGLVGPAELPDDITQALIETSRRVHESEQFQEFAKERGYVAVWDEGEKFKTFMQAFAEDKGTLIEDLGIAQ